MSIFWFKRKLNHFALVEGHTVIDENTQSLQQGFNSYSKSSHADTFLIHTHAACMELSDEATTANIQAGFGIDLSVSAETELVDCFPVSSALCRPFV